MSNRTKSIVQKLIDNAVYADPKKMSHLLNTYNHNGFDLHGDAEEAIENISGHVPILYTATDTGGVKSEYDADSDIIFLPQARYYNTVQGYYYATFHQIAHSVHLSDRLGWQFRREEIKADHAMSDLIADVTAYIMLAELHMITPEIEQFCAERVRVNLVSLNCNLDDIPDLINGVNAVKHWIETYSRAPIQMAG